MLKSKNKYGSKTKYNYSSKLGDIKQKSANGLIGLVEKQKSIGSY